VIILVTTSKTLHLSICFYYYDYSQAWVIEITIFIFSHLCLFEVEFDSGIAAFRTWYGKKRRNLKKTGRTISTTLHTGGYSEKFT
jgi:hypothetical protein